MAGTLLIIGLTLFLMGSFMLASDAHQRGRSPLIFVLPFAGASYIRHYWSDVWLSALMRVAGMGLLVLAFAVALGRDPAVMEHPKRLFGGSPAVTAMVGSKQPQMNTFANSEAAVLLAIRSDANPKLSGRLYGRPFVYDAARLIDGVLTVQQGEGFIPELEARLLLDLDAATIGNTRRTLYVRPGDSNAPELQISWTSQEGGQLNTRILRGGYSMELQLVRRDRETLSGFLQVILPDPDRSHLSGEFLVRTNFLRYIGERVDLTFDHTDTVEYVARQYLETQFPENLLADIRFRNTRMMFSESSGSTTAEVSLANGQIEERRLLLDRADIGWAVRPGSMETRILQVAGSNNVRLLSPAALSAPRSSGQPLVQDVPDPIAMSFAALDTLTGQEVVVFQRDGRRREGLVRGVRRERLLVESMVGAGLVELRFAEQELSHLQLANGQRVDIGDQVASHSQDTETEHDADSAAVVDEPTEPSALAPYLGWQGRTVTVTGRDTRVRTGVVTAISARQLTLTVRVGAGTLEYFYSPADIDSIVEAN